MSAPGPRGRWPWPWLRARPGRSSAAERPFGEAEQRRAFAAACLGMLLFGVVMTTLGAVLPLLTERHGLARTSAGSFLTLMGLGILTTSPAFGPIVDRFGYRPALVAGTVLVGVGLAALAWARSPGPLAPAMFAFGCGGGLLNGATNALAADLAREGRGSGLALLGAFYGIGAFGVPFVLGLLLRWAAYPTIIGGLALLVAAPLGAFLVVRLPPPKQPRGFPLRRAGALLGDASLLLTGLALFCQSGAEFTLGGWSAQYVHDALKLNEERSILVLSLFWAGLTTARLVLARLLRGRSPARVFAGSLTIALIGSALLLAANDARFVGAGLFLLGFGLAAGYPVLLGFLADVYRDLTGTAYSAVFVMALCGGSLLPYLAGILADRHGPRASLAIVPAALLAQGALLVALRRRLESPAAAPGDKNVPWSSKT